MADPVNALAPKPSLVNELYRAVVPTNARMLIDTVRGETAPITEKDFSPEELEVLKQMYAQQQSKNETRRQKIANQLSISQKDYDKKPEYDMVYRDENGRQVGRSVLRSYEDHILKLTDQLKSFDRTRNKTSLSYNDYPDQLAAPTFDSWLSSVWKSYTDPAYRMKTILGSYNVIDTPEGRKAVDTYKFDKADYYRGNYGIDPATASVSKIFSRANGPIDFLDMMMIKKFPRAARPVDIKMGR